MTNELYRHGILGQKWGVRRYQNPDGTLTKAGKKRYDKTVAYKDKLAQKHDRWSKEAMQDAAFAKDKMKDVKKYGTNSTYYQQYKNEQLDNKKELMKAYGYSDSEVKMSVNIQKISDMVNRSNELQKYMSILEDDYADAIDNAKTWAASRDAIMAVKVEDFTTRSDIRKAGRVARSNA